MHLFLYRAWKSLNKSAKPRYSYFNITVLSFLFLLKIVIFITLISRLLLRRGKWKSSGVHLPDPISSDVKMFKKINAKLKYFNCLDIGFACLFQLGTSVSWASCDKMQWEASGRWLSHVSQRRHQTDKRQRVSKKTSQKHTLRNVRLVSYLNKIRSKQYTVVLLCFYERAFLIICF